jgi:hypothetical protein
VLKLSFSRQELHKRQAAVTTVPNRWVGTKPISLTIGLAQEKEKHFAARIKPEKENYHGSRNIVRWWLEMRA